MELGIRAAEKAEGSPEQRAFPVPRAPALGRPGGLRGSWAPWQRHTCKGGIYKEAPRDTPAGAFALRTPDSAKGSPYPIPGRSREEGVGRKLAPLACSTTGQAGQAPGCRLTASRSDGSLSQRPCLPPLPLPASKLARL